MVYLQKCVSYFKVVNVVLPIFLVCCCEMNFIFYYKSGKFLFGIVIVSEKMCDLMWSYLFYAKKVILE